MLLQYLLGTLTGLAILAIWQSQASAPLCVLLSLWALLHGVVVVGRYRRQPWIAFLFPGDESPVLVDGQPTLQVKVEWRGRLAFIRWRDAGSGRLHYRSWWPDTLSARHRRELRLAATAAKTSPLSRGMAL